MWVPSLGGSERTMLLPGVVQDLILHLSGRKFGASHKSQRDFFFYFLVQIMTDAA